MSAAAALDSIWATLLAPGMATTCGRWITQASAICAGVASWAAATSRSASSTGAALRRFSSENSRFRVRTPLGALAAVYLPDSTPWASGL
jgi:hypothetical protein